MLHAHLKDDDFLADVHRTRDQQPDALHVWWLGQSGFLVCSQGKALLFDPYLSDSLSRKYAGTEKEHVRMSEQVIDPTRLDFIDVVTSSHNHTDHLDHETLLPLRQANPELAFIIPEANREFVAERLQTPPEWPVGLNAALPGSPPPPNHQVTVKDIHFTAVPAAHDAFETDEHGNARFLGYLATIGPWTVYHSGDTVPIPGLAEILRPHIIHAALLPINGRLEERRVAGNLWGQEAAALAHSAGAQTAIPCHYDMFTFNTESPNAFTEACQVRGQRFQVLKHGERVSLRK